MDDSFTGGTVKNHAKGEQENAKPDDPLHLKIDTSVVIHNNHHGFDIPRPTSNSIRGTEAVQAETNIDKNLSHSRPSDAHARLRAMSESERALFNSGTGVRIPQKHAVHLDMQLTPPPSNSPGFFDTHNPYSTSAHIFPADSPPKGFPESPQSNTNPTFLRRNSKGLLLSLGSSNHKPASADIRSPFEGVARSFSYSYGVSPLSRQRFVDASSYDSVPESPAKLVYFSILLMLKCSGSKDLLRKPSQLPYPMTKVKKSAHTSSAVK